MEETWQVKCSSSWPAQSALPAAAGSCNHINMDAQQFYRPTGMQVPNRGGSQMLQEPLLPCSFNTDLGKSGNSETGNSFLALLSGNWNHLSGELLHSPNSRSQLPKFLVPNGDALGQSTSHSFSANCISPLSKFHSNDAFFSGDLPSFIASPPLFSTSSIAPNIQPLRSHSHILGSPKAVTRCFSEDIIRGIGVSSKRCGPPSPSSSAIQNQNNQTSHNSSSDATVHGLIAPPSFFIGRPRVFCMNTTGELFLNDMGLLGVLCSCHCLPMSVAKFCQHSGLSATNPSDAIRMDSGMTLAQWCKICFGNLASGDLRGSEPLKYSSVERSTIGSKAPGFHSFSKNHGIINSVEEFGGPGRSGELRKNLYPHHPDLVGYASMEKPVKNDMTYDHEKRNSVVNGRAGIAGLTRVSMPVVSENNNLHAVKGKSELMDTKMPHSTISNRREQNVVSHLISNDIKCRVTSANSSVSYSPWPKNFFSHDKNDSPRSNSSNEAFVVGRDGSDLRLGQPSQHKHSSISSFSAAMMVQHQNQLSDKSNLPADCAREVKRSRLNQSYPLIEASSSDKRLTDAEGLTTTSLHNSESENLLTYANKDSSISLFLSHLTGGTDLCGTYNKTHDETNNLTNSIHYDLPSSKENISLSSGNEIGEAWKASSFNEVVYCNDKGNPSVVIADNCSNVAGNNDVNSMQIEDKRVSPPFISGQCLRPCPVGVEKSSLFSSQPFRSLQKGPDAKNLSILEEAYHNHFVHGSEIGGSHWIGLSGSPDSETPITRSSTNSNYISEASCLSCKQDKKFSDHLMDGNLRLLASARHESLMDKQEQLGGSFKMKQHGRLYCLSTTEPHRNSCSEDLVEHKDVTRCSINQNASDLHSLSNCFCNNRFGASHCKCGSAASFKCCNFATSTQSTTPCSKCSSYHVCGTDRHVCFRPRDILIDTSLDNVQHEMCIYKAGNLPFSGNCCCAIISKCQSSCCFGGAVIAADTTNNQNVNGMLKHLNLTFDEDVTFQKERKVGLDHCAYCKKMVVMQNNCQTCFWRDVSGKNTGYSAAAPDNHLKTSEAPRVDKPTEEIGSKNSDATFKASTSLVEQQMSNRSGSSAPAITEVSVELNKKEAQVVNAENTMIFDYSEFDEGSAIEKCSSSDEMIDAEKCKEVSDTCCKVLASNSRHDFTSRLSSPNIMDELKFRDSPNQMSVRNKISTRCKDQEDNCGRRRLTAVRELRNRKKSPKAPKGVFHFAHSEPLDSIDKVKYLQLSKRDGVSMHPETIVESTDVVSSGSLNIKRKSSDLTSSKFISLKKLENQNLQMENSKHLPEESEFLVAMEENVNFSLHGKRHLYQPMNHPNGERPPKYMSLSRIVDSRNHETEASTTSKRPVVCGNSGVISSGELNALQKPAKLVPLNLILKKAKRCRSNWEVEPKTSLFSKMVCADTKDLHCSDSSFCKSTVDSGNPYFGRSEVGSGRFFLSGTKSHVSNLGFGKGIKGARYASIISRSNSMNKADTGEQWQINRRIEPFPVDAKALCSVCGSSNNEAINCLLECNRCMIRVHQACYGIYKFPKDLWYCRPCKADSNSQNIACVLCGYDGGAMTRALRSTNIVRSLLKVWKVTVRSTSRKIVCPFESMKDEVLNVSSLKADEAENDEYSFLPSVGSRSFEASPEAAAAIDERNLKNTIPEIDSFTDKVNANNSIIKGAFDPSVMQWVHVVCGLWTPGTRCANVDTMDAFDVCGVLPTSKNIICSLCFRPGGSSIKCRDSNCSIHFHPWCAHQNGLLQSEIEGEANEKVAFYGKCTLHARNNFHHSDKQLMNLETPNPRIKEWSCARTEGFRGRGIGFILNYQKSFNDGDGCIVSQVQINAWLHINGQKSCMIGVKPTCSDVEYDLRKEYIRYKLSKGWKRLVVYKSGIHALGLYTSQFIARGAMVVEYVGEIVGLRVADKREIEYQSGRRLQCKSACYFFRIDKEHIIDATRKGGIARFVNHSCLPNCVAKIISIKNEKKVVFFAERDINPGEEITYDYHFNREDEGKKIPCFCNSKNCRRYLN